MRAAELGLEDDTLQLGPVPKRYQLEYLIDPKVMTEILYRTIELTDEAYTELVDDIGLRAARLILRAKALSGDVRAIDLYMRIGREDAERRKDRGKPPARSVHTAGFVQDGRSTNVEPVESPTPVVIDPLQK